MKKITSRLGFVLMALAFLAQSQPREKTPTSAPKVGKEYHPPGTKGGPMVFVSAGEFTMGLGADAALKECQRYRNDCKREWYAEEQPAHRVDLDAFYIDKYEVTQGEYSECVRAGKRKGRCQDNYKYDGFTGERQPIVGVTWDQAKKYCEWAGKRLPTEAEWEKAARGTDGRMYPWGSQKASCELANYDDCKIGKTWPVGTKPAGASPYGALDMAGNVWEWVADWYDDKYYSNSPSKNPTGPASGSTRVLRGGCWSYTAWDARASTRSDVGVPAGVGTDWGFRCSGD